MNMNIEDIILERRPVYRLTTDNEVKIDTFIDKYPYLQDVLNQMKEYSKHHDYVRLDITEWDETPAELWPLVLIMVKGQDVDDFESLKREFYEKYLSYYTIFIFESVKGNLTVLSEKEDIEKKLGVDSKNKPIINNKIILHRKDNQPLSSEQIDKAKRFEQLIYEEDAGHRYTMTIDDTNNKLIFENERIYPDFVNLIVGVTYNLLISAKNDIISSEEDSGNREFIRNSLKFALTDMQVEIELNNPFDKYVPEYTEDTFIRDINQILKEMDEDEQE